jgi:hypothetical protein
VVAALPLALLAACGTGSAPTLEGECTGSIRFQGVVYVPNTAVNQAAPPGRTLGPGAVVDCDKRTVVDRVTVSAVRGAESRLAIRIVRSRWHGVYVADDVSRVEWPTVVRQR